MFQSRGTFENEKIELQGLNKRLVQYLSRVKQLEQENAFLITEINAVRKDRTVKWENQHMMELRELRRAADQLAFEKSRAEMEREKMWRELQKVQAMCREELEVRRNIDGDLKGCEKELHQAERTSSALEERLFQLENEYKILEDAQRREITHVRNQVCSREMPVVARQNYHAPQAFTTEEIEEYAQTLSDRWTENFAMYQRNIEQLEESIRADEAKLEDLVREKMQYASELKNLHSEAEKQNQLQAHLEEQLMNMEDSCQMEFNQYQVVMDELEEERRALANAISEKLRDHQELMQVKMGLSMELAAYRALLEAESKDVLVWTEKYSREAPRRKDVKMPARSYTRGSSTLLQDARRHPPTSTAFNVRYTEPISTVRMSSASSQPRSYDVKSTAASATSLRDNRNTSARKDLLSFTTSSRATTRSAKPAIPDAEKRAKTAEEMPVRSKEVSQDLAKGSVRSQQSGSSPGSGAGPSPTSPAMKPNAEEASGRSVRVVSPPMMSLISDVKEDVKRQIKDVKVIKVDTNEHKLETGVSKVATNHGGEEARSYADWSQNVTAGTWGRFGENQSEGRDSDEAQMEAERDFDDANVEAEMFPSEQKVLDSISMEDIIEKFMRPAGLDTKLTSSPDSKVTYHVEKTEEEDGTTKTKIVLQSKVEEDLDMGDESALEELLCKEVKTIALEDIKGTPTGDMIENLLSLGFQGAGTDLSNKSVNVEIIEEPVEDYSDEESEGKPAPKVAQPSSTFFQIEELENDPQASQPAEGSVEVAKASMAAGGYRQVESVTFQEGSGDMDSPYYTRVQETEYFVSTPEDNASEPEEESEFPAYGHYGAVDNLSDERYYQGERANEKSNQEGPVGGSYTVRVPKDEDDAAWDVPWMDNKGHGDRYTEESVTEVSKTEKHIKLGPSEKSFTFQMDVGGVSGAAAASDGSQQD
ncbi:hypothetical protein AAFF_G00224190 [Aldrovandia affinis]|uniref:IF rod domain-containing protein n=1 Tax=Aldrovandia affinis TaxID=143900 RepID=A0AAD7TCD8_9TELE|nr:hypothetical protein AAFF_G00224190 [Aldrovandia affinis]